MTSTNPVSRAEWLEARLQLYSAEQDMLATRDEVSEQRRKLPWVAVDQSYVFDSADGERTLLDLFDGRRQLIVYHFMVPPATGEFCVSCSFWVDNIGHLAHLHARDTSLVVDCPVAVERVLAFRERMEWSVPFVSSARTDFYSDFHFTTADGDRMAPGISVFIREGERIFHTYSTLRYGGEMLNSTYHYLDLTPLGRQEDGLSFKHDWVRLHDQYDAEAQAVKR